MAARVTLPLTAAIQAVAQAVVLALVTRIMYGVAVFIIIQTHLAATCRKAV